MSRVCPRNSSNGIPNGQDFCQAGRSDDKHIMERCGTSWSRANRRAGGNPRERQASLTRVVMPNGSGGEEDFTIGQRSPMNHSSSMVLRMRPLWLFFRGTGTRHTFGTLISAETSVYAGAEGVSLIREISLAGTARGYRYKQLTRSTRLGETMLPWVIELLPLIGQCSNSWAGVSAPSGSRKAVHPRQKLTCFTRSALRM
jgi:hypothetical protein